jgi:hypothetical protein
MRWSSDRYDQLESATRSGKRVALERRGTEYVVIAVDLRMVGSQESLIGRLPMTGEELTFALNDLTAFQVIDPEDG